ncbi:MAG: beta-galactosidase, partial [Candidatus Sumerlaeia bacterium]|nr:beta-galactosidase [Candidatus Sumerlaeia bacterium]
RSPNIAPHSDSPEKLKQQIYRTLTGLLTNVILRREWTPAEKCHLLELSSRDACIYIFWSEDGMSTLQFLCTTTETVKVIFLTGEEKVLAPEEGRIFITATKMPLFVVSKTSLSASVASAPVSFKFSAQNELPKGKSIKLQKTISDKVFENIYWRIKPAPPFDEQTVTQIAPNELYVNQQAKNGKITVLTEVFPLTGIRPFALLFNEVKIIEPVAIWLSPLPPDNGKKCVLIELRNVTSEPLSGKINIYELQGFKLSREEKNIEQLEGGRSLILPVSIVENTEPDQIFHFRIEVALADGSLVKWDSPPVTFYQTPYCDTQRKIDGSLADWDSALSPIRLVSPEKVMDISRESKKPESSSTLVYTCWDPKYFYIAAEIEDNKLSTTFNPLQISQNYALDIYLEDESIIKNNMTEEDDTSQVLHFSISLNRNNTASGGQNDYPRNQSANLLVSVNLNPDEKQTLGQRQFKGRIVEAAIPLSELNLKPYNGKQVNFAVQIRDIAETTTVFAPTSQDVRLVWGGSLKETPRMPGLVNLFFVRKEVPLRAECKNGWLYLGDNPFFPYGFWVTGFSMQRLVELAQHSGINAIATEVSWAEAELEEGVFNQEYFDRLIALLKLAQKINIKVLLQLGGHNPPDWLLTKYPHFRFLRSDGTPGIVNSGKCCPDNQEFQKHLFRFVKETVKRVKFEPAIIGYSLWNEPGLTAEVCYCTDTVKAFQRYLALKYAGSSERLNSTWKSNYQSFNEVLPPLVVDSEPKEKGGKWLDWVEFRQQSLRDFFLSYARTIKDGDPYHLLTLKFNTQPADSRHFAFSAVRYDYFLDMIDVMGTNPQPYPFDFFVNRWLADTLRSAVLQHQHNKQAPIWWLGFNRAFCKQFGQPTPEEARVWVYQCLAQGISGIFFFFYPLEAFRPQEDDSELALVYADDHTPLPVTSEIFKLAPEVEQLAKILPEYQPLSTPIAIFCSLSTLTHQAGKPRPTAEMSTAAEILYRLQLPFDLITENNIYNDALNKYKLLVVAGVENCGEKVLQRIQNFIEKGGWCIAGAGFARKSESGTGREIYPPSFTGVAVDDYRYVSRLTLTAYFFPYLAEFNTRRTEERTLDVKRANRSVIRFVQDFGKLKKGQEIMAGPISGFPDTRLTEELIESIWLQPETKLLAVFPDGKPAITMNNRCVYIASDISWSDENMIALFDEIIRQAGITAEAYAAYSGDPQKLVPHIDVRCWRKITQPQSISAKQDEKLIFFINSPRLFDYTGTPITAVLAVKGNGEIFTIDGKKVQTTKHNSYQTFTEEFSPAATRIYRVRK